MRGLILAAGLGERLRPLTLKRAKPAVEFLNVPMLTFPYHWLDGLGLSALTLNTHYLPDTVRDAARAVVAANVELHFTHEDHILGSGGGIWNARAHLTGESNFAVANGDAVVLFARPDELARMRAHHEAEDALATLLTCPLAGVGETIPGVWSDARGAVLGFGKSAPRAGATCAHYASFLLLSERVWDDFPPGASNILYDVLVPRIARGERVRTHHVRDLAWFETGNQKDYLGATARCLTEWRDQTSLGRAVAAVVGRAPDARGPASDLAAGRLIAASAAVDPAAASDGFAVVGARATVAAGARVTRGVVLPGASLGAGASLTDAVLI